MKEYEKNIVPSGLFVEATMVASRLGAKGSEQFWFHAGHGPHISGSEDWTGVSRRIQ